MSIVAVILWAVAFLLAIPYTRRVRHPDQRPLAAFLIFVTVFTVSAFVLFMFLIWLMEGLLGLNLLSQPSGAALFLIVVFAPSFLLARWQTRKPPRPAPRL